MPIEIKWERALLNFEKQLGAPSTARENLNITPIKKHVEIYADPIE